MNEPAVSVNPYLEPQQHAVDCHYETVGCASPSQPIALDLFGGLE